MKSAMKYFFLSLKTDGPVTTGYKAVRKYYRELRRKLSDHVLRTIIIDVTSVCNLKCIMCLRDDCFIQNRKMENMDSGLFKKIVDEAASMGVERLQVNFFGEPLLHPEILDMIDYASDRMKTEFTSNAMLLDEEKIGRLVASNLHKINFSFHGGSNSLSKVMVGADYDTIKKNIMAFVEERKRQNKTRPYIAINCLIMRETKDEIVDEIRYWRNYVEEVYPAYVVIHKGRDMGMSLIPEGEDVSPKNKGDLLVCGTPFNTLIIGPDGRTTACCRDSLYTFDLGNVKTQSIKEIWESEKLNRMRGFIRKKEYEKAFPLCMGCTETNAVFEKKSKEALSQFLKENKLEKE